MRSLLALEPDFTVIADTTNAKEVTRRIKEEKPDILLLGLGLPDEALEPLLSELSRLSPETRTILLTDPSTDLDLLQMVRAGAKGGTCMTVLR